MTDNKPTDWLCQKLPTTIHKKAPRKKHLRKLIASYNEQCDRLALLFDDIAKTGQRITFKGVMPKSARKNRAKEIRKERNDSDGYKRFLKEEGFDDLL
tara:strand:+ start:352 stop:645 length:294 start_codon:yes stop_codon:yes gene_type:complete